ncbi:MAG: histidine kinase [Nostoc sp. CreGUA01]|nr:histidine kinase [Nostoc sp. CreGUA01]
MGGVGGVGGWGKNLFPPLSPHSPMPHAPCPMPHAPCPIPHSPFPKFIP